MADEMLIGNNGYDKDIVTIVRETLKRYRNTNQYTRDHMAQITGTSAETWERYETKTKRMEFQTVIQMLKGLPIEERVQLFCKIGILDDKATPNKDHYIIDEALSSYDSSDNHITRLQNYYADTRYKLYYYDTRRGNDNINSMNLQLKQVMDTGYIGGMATVQGKFSYSCKLISPNGSQYTYIYLTSEGTVYTERAIIMLPLSQRTSGKYLGGIGIMFSLSIEDNQSLPCFQKVAVVSQNVRELTNKQIKAICDKYLLVSTESINKNFHYVRKVYGDQLVEESSRFYDAFLKDRSDVLKDCNVVNEEGE